MSSAQLQDTDTSWFSAAWEDYTNRRENCVPKLMALVQEFLKLYSAFANVQTYLSVGPGKKLKLHRHYNSLPNKCYNKQMSMCVRHCSYGTRLKVIFNGRKVTIVPFLHFRPFLKEKDSNFFSILA